MTDAQVVVAHGLWLLGAATVLATFSYFEWWTRKTGRRLGDVLWDEPGWRLSLAIASTLAATGLLLLDATNWWLRALWGFTTLGVLGARWSVRRPVLDRVARPALQRLIRFARGALICTGAVSVTLFFWLSLRFPIGIDTWLDASEQPIESDAIVCIGGETGPLNLPLPDGWECIHTAIELFRDEWAPVVVFTGRGSMTLSEAEAYADAAIWLGLRRDGVLLDPVPSRIQEYPFTLLAAGKGRFTRQSRLLLVTRPIHSRRVLLTFRKHGFSRVRVVSSYSSSQGPAPAGRERKASTLQEFTPSTNHYDGVFDRLRHGSHELLAALGELVDMAYYRWKGWM